MQTIRLNRIIKYMILLCFPSFAFFQNESIVDILGICNKHIWSSCKAPLSCSLYQLCKIAISSCVIWLNEMLHLGIRLNRFITLIPFSKIILKVEDLKCDEHKTTGLGVTPTALHVTTNFASTNFQFWWTFSSIDTFGKNPKLDYEINKKTSSAHFFGGFV